MTGVQTCALPIYDRSAKTGGTGGHLTEFFISTPAETQGAENSGQADPLVMNLEEIRWMRLRLLHFQTLMLKDWINKDGKN